MATCTGTTSLRDAVRDAEASYDGSCVIYFAQAGEFGPIKVGITTAARLQRRIEELQNGCPWRVILRRAIPGSRGLERLLHRVLRPLKMNGEWFYPDPLLAKVAGANVPAAHDSDPIRLSR